LWLENNGMVKIYCFLIFLQLFLCKNSIAQTSGERGDIRLMFYNVENLFDTIDNPSTNDEEFLPGGSYHWNNYRYWKKLKKIYQVIAAAGEDSPPEIIGLCEVENFLPLYNLTNNQPLSKYPYTIIHRDSPDERGIDVALLCRKDKVKVLKYSFIEIRLKDKTIKKTREILFATLLTGNDTLHIFVNHWPSRRGGEDVSEKYRIQAANTLKQPIDSLLQINKNAKIVVMGDFNDGPDNQSMLILSKSGLLNMADGKKETCKCGTLKYKSYWDLFDQMLVSQGLLMYSKLRTSNESFGIFEPDFLLVTDETYGGKKPFRTYQGPKYLGGFSDHLPVLLDLYY
jgi:predicted extracellular nuclease